MATDITGRDIVRPADLVAEFIGTFTLIFVGVGSVLATSQTQSNDLLTIAVAHGFALIVMISALVHVSGAHFNPAVSFGAWITQRISGIRMIAYWSAQLIGATLAALLLRWLIPSSVWKPVHLGAASLGKNASGQLLVHGAQAMVMEAVLTFFLVWVVFATLFDEDSASGKIAPIAIGATFMIGILIAGPFTGAAMNPARAFGPALASGTWANFWIWVVGPLGGGAAGALAYERLILRPRGQ